MEIPRSAVEAVINQAKVEGVFMDESDAYFIAQAAIRAYTEDPASASSIGHFPVPLYAKIAGEEIPAGDLRLPVYAEGGKPVKLRVGATEDA